MQSNEIRIGNFVNYYEKPENDFPVFHGVKKVAGISPAGVKLANWLKSIPESTIIEANGNGIYPVLLNMEWLKSFGFARDFDRLGNETDSYFSKDFHLMPIHNNEYWVTVGGLGGYKLPFGIKYVHELQNLYFTLFQEELELQKNKE